MARRFPVKIDGSRGLAGTSRVSGAVFLCRRDILNSLQVSKHSPLCEASVLAKPFESRLKRFAKNLKIGMFQ